MEKSSGVFGYSPSFVGYLSYVYLFLHNYVKGTRGKNRIEDSVCTNQSIQDREKSCKG